MQRRMLLSFLLALLACPGCTDDVSLAREDDGSGGAGTPGSSSSSSSSGAGNGGSGATGGDTGSGGDGASSAGGSGSGGSGAGPVSLPECITDADCQLVNDCCRCEAIPADEPVIECTANCEISFCEAMGGLGGGVQCVAGTCVAGFDCTSLVTCAQPEPGCPAGMVAARSGGCWGSCVPTTECSAVTECDACDLASQTCVQYVAFSVSVHCAPQPDTCTGPADCACAADAFCTGIYDQCSGGGGILSCECPTC